MGVKDISTGKGPIGLFELVGEAWSKASVHGCHGQCQRWINWSLTLFGRSGQVSVMGVADTTGGGQIVLREFMRAVRSSVIFGHLSNVMAYCPKLKI
jgi:hypothetical protein